MEKGVRKSPLTWEDRKTWGRGALVGREGRKLDSGGGNESERKRKQKVKFCSVLMCGSQGSGKENGKRAYRLWQGGKVGPGGDVKRIWCGSFGSCFRLQGAYRLLPEKKKTKKKKKKNSSRVRLSLECRGANKGPKAGIIGELINCNAAEVPRQVVGQKTGKKRIITSSSPI